MTHPVRFYITCDDDRPVIRSVPVSVRPQATERAGARPELKTAPEPQALPAQGRMARLVRAAVGRRDREQ
jgi:hypothetical protein